MTAAPTLAQIEAAVCRRFGMSRQILLSRTRLRKIARPRQIAMYLARTLTGKSYPAIGAWFRRNHTTVLYAERRIVALMALKPKVQAHVDALKAELRGATL